MPVTFSFKQGEIFFQYFAAHILFGKVFKLVVRDLSVAVFFHEIEITLVNVGGENAYHPFFVQTAITLLFEVTFKCRVLFKFISAMSPMILENAFKDHFSRFPGKAELANLFGW